MMASDQPSPQEILRSGIGLLSVSVLVVLDNESVRAAQRQCNLQRLLVAVTGPTTSTEWTHLYQDGCGPGRPAD